MIRNGGRIERNTHPDTWKDAALSVGMVEYLEKPVTKEVMKETIERYISGRLSHA